MKHAEGTYGGFKNLGIYFQHWQPDSAPRAVIVIVHGYAEHSGRYQHVAEFFAERGYAVYASDHRGHGRSEGERAYVERFDDFVRDLRTFVDVVQQREPERRLFVIGHSMGGAIAALFGAERGPSAEHGRSLEGLILSGAYVRPSGGVSPVLVRLLKLLSTVVPKLGVTPLDSAGVSRDPDVAARYDADPLNYRGRVRARMAAELFQAGDRVLANLHAITVPILIMHGAADKLADPEGSRLIYDGVSSTDKTLKIYEGLYHEIFNEPERDRVLADVAGWLDQRSAF